MTAKTFGRLLLLTIAAVCIFSSLSDAQTGLLYTQPPDAGGAFYQSSQTGNDSYDEYVFDNFKVSSPASIKEIDWHGMYDPTKISGALAVDSFTIKIYASIPGGTQPVVASSPLTTYQIAGNARETAEGTFGGNVRYIYKFVLTAPFAALADSTYWIQIEAKQSGGLPNWSIAKGTLGNGSHIRGLANQGDIQYLFVPNDAAFTLYNQPVAINQNNYKSNQSLQIMKVLFSGRTGSSLRLALPQNLVGGTLSMIDLCGRSIVNNAAIQSSDMVVNTRHVTAGLFIVSMTKDGFRYSNKIMVH